MLDLIKANIRQEGIPLQPGKDGHKRGAFLFVDKIKLHRETPSTTNNSILHSVAENGSVQAVCQLLEWNADINALNLVLSSQPYVK